MRCQNATKNAANLFVHNLRKFQKFTVSSIYRIIQLKISFHDDNFRVDFFPKTQILSYLVYIFLAWSLNIFRGIIKIKIQISIGCLEKNFCKNSYQIEIGQLVGIANKRRI